MLKLRTLFNPDMYHGFNRKPPFFEGWYYKIVNQDGSQRFAIIPGVILGANGHAFIQLLNGSSGQSLYYTFPLKEFRASPEHFEVIIGENRFTNETISLQIIDQEQRLQGELNFPDISPWPVTLFSPGIMGWYAWVPRMETYHGVVSLDHSIQGSLNINADKIDFNHGRGYTEKDWGASFPEAYIWFQTNHFDVPGISLTASVAIIPWIKNAFRGFIIGFWYQGKLYRFATYTGAKLEKMQTYPDRFRWTVKDSRYRLETNTSRAGGGLLRGPNTIEMGKRINETMSSQVEVRLSTLSGETIFSGVGRYAGLEAHGDLEKLIAME
jgi:hypothetical protein